MDQASRSKASSNTMKVFRKFIESVSHHRFILDRELRKQQMKINKPFLFIYNHFDHLDMESNPSHEFSLSQFIFLL